MLYTLGSRWLKKHILGTRPRDIEKRPQRTLRRSARLADTQGAKTIDGEPKNSLPSPPTSNILSKEVRRPSILLLLYSRAYRVQAQQHSPSPPKLEAVKASQQPQESDANRRLERKRKRSQEDYCPDLQTWHEPIGKRARNSSPGCAIGNETGAGDIDLDEDHSIEHWIETIPWPECSFDKGFDKGFEMSQHQFAKKRSSSAMSYSQGVKEGIYPAAHTSTYEKEILEPAGIILDQQLGEATIGHDARKLCQTLLKATYEIPENSLFEGDLFWKVLNGVRNEGEGRVVRDLQPDVVPSAEILSFRGLSKVNYLKETIKILWNNVVSLAGPTPCPDLTVGLLPSAFTELELDKLHRRHNTSDTPSRFTGNLYFPFFTCEAKCGANGLNESDRQNARSAATAINAILQLYRQGKETHGDSGATSAVDQLYREVLFFSISHDHTFVKIFGHYPLIKEDKTHFYRHLISSFDLTAGAGENRWTAYNFVRKLYDDFAPIHLKRIQDAISLLPEKSESFMSITNTEAELELSDSQETASAPASLDNEGFVRPPLPPKKKRQLKQQALSNASTAEAELQNKNSQIVVLQRELERQREEAKQREDQLREESKQQLARELERQREEAKHREDQLREESKQQHAELMDLLKEQMEQNKKLINMQSKG